MRSKLLLSFLSISLFSFSQDSVFHIKDYKYRTPGYRALALNLNFSGNYNNRSENDVNAERWSSTNLGPVYARYYHIRSTDRRFQETSISIGGGYSSNSVKDPSRNDHLNRLASQAAWLVQTRDYKANQWFLEWGNDLRGDFGSGKTQTPTFHSQSTEVFARNTVTIGFGKGRIEWVQDAQMAMYILQDLSSQNLLSRAPTAEETNAFAQLITDVNNRRVFDTRRRRIYELSRIDSFLKSSGLATQTDIRHFTTINDNWAFAINPFRRSGSAWFARLKPGVHFERDRSTNKHQPQPSYTQAIVSSLYFSPEIGYENYWPMNLKWQRNFGVEASYIGQQYNYEHKAVTSTGGTETKNNYYTGNWVLNTFYGIGYFPNTRTQVTADLNLRTSYYNRNTWALEPSFRLSADYFLGYRTYLMGSLAAVYLYNRYGDGGVPISRTKLFYGSFALSLSHYIF